MALQEPPAPAAPKLKPSAPAQPGRGGVNHKHVQAEIKGVAEGFGFRASIEAAIPNSDASVDVLLQKGNYSVACEICVTGTIQYEVGNATKCLNAGYSHVAVICDDTEKIEKIKAAILSSVDAAHVARLGFYSAPGLIAWLQDQAPPLPSSSVNRGYKVNRSSIKLTPAEAKAREKAAMKMVAEAMKRKGD